VIARAANGDEVLRRTAELLAEEIMTDTKMLGR
jgi:hypothetical protein